MLTFNLKKKWFELIKSGKKTHEYRTYKDFYIKKIINFLLNKYNSKYICFSLGYPSKKVKDRRLYAKVKDIRIISGKSTDLKCNCKVFDIEFKLVKKLLTKK